jgi:hypothetical protein
LMEFHGKFHGKFHGNFHGKFHGIPWNYVNWLNFMEFGFDRVKPVNIQITNCCRYRKKTYFSKKKFFNK